MNHRNELSDVEIEQVRHDICPDCKSPAGLVPGPRGGIGQNVFCSACHAGFNVAYPRMVIWGQRIGPAKNVISARVIIAEPS